MDFSFKDVFRNHVEQVSNGKNTVIYDKFGNPNIMYVLRKFDVSQFNSLFPDCTEGTAYPFRVGDREVDEIFISKYHNGVGDGGVPVSYPAMFPAHGTYKEINDMVRKKGSGWKFFSSVEFRTLMLLGLCSESTPLNKFVGDEPLDGVAGCQPQDSDRGQRYRKPGTHHPKYNHDGTQFGVTGLMQDRWSFTPGALIAPDGEFWVTGKAKDQYTNDPTWFGSRENMTPTGIYVNKTTVISTTPYKDGDYNGACDITPTTVAPSYTRAVAIMLGLMPVPIADGRTMRATFTVGYDLDHFCVCGGSQWDYHISSLSNENSHLNSYFQSSYQDDYFINAGGHAFRTTYIPELDKW